MQSYLKVRAKSHSLCFYTHFDIIELNMRLSNNSYKYFTYSFEALTCVHTLVFWATCTHFDVMNFDYQVILRCV